MQSNSLESIFPTLPPDNTSLPTSYTQVHPLGATLPHLTSVVSSDTLSPTSHMQSHSSGHAFPHRPFSFPPLLSSSSSPPPPPVSPSHPLSLPPFPPPSSLTLSSILSSLSSFSSLSSSSSSFSSSSLPWVSPSSSISSSIWGLAEVKDEEGSREDLYPPREGGMSMSSPSIRMFILFHGSQFSDLLLEGILSKKLFFPRCLDLQLIILTSIQKSCKPLKTLQTSLIHLSYLSLAAI